MGQLRSVSHSLMLQGKTPREVLCDLDTFAQRVPSAYCTTVFCALVDPIDGTVHYSSAGHPPAVLAHRSGTSQLLEGAASVPLAISVAERREAAAELTPGCTLVLYTDGLVERRAEPLDLGIDHLKDVIDRNREREIQSLANAIIEDMQAAGSEDDVALLIYRLPVSESPRFAAAMPADASELGTLRKKLRKWLEDAGLTDVADDVVLSVCEACSNSIEHAYQFDPNGMIDVRAQIEGSRLTIDVADSGHWKVPDPTATQRGRGLTLVKVLMGGYTVETSNSGTIIHLRRELERDP